MKDWGRIKDYKKRQGEGKRIKGLDKFIQKEIFRLRRKLIN